MTQVTARNPNYVQGKMSSPRGHPNVGAGTREVGTCLALEIFKTQLNRPWKTWLNGKHFEEALELDNHRMSQHQLFFMN